MSKQTLTAFYDNREFAKNAALMLGQAGVPNADIDISPETASSRNLDATQPQTTGFWASLENMFGGTEDHSTYVEGLRRGGIMLTAHVDGAKVDDAILILERHGSVDLNERETEWRGEGWTGGTVTGGGVASEGAGPLRSMAPVDDTETNLTSTRTTTPPVAAYKAPDMAIRSTGNDGVIQIFEETLDVGKRAVNRGKVRLHTHVVETPVSEVVSLRDETVTIDRRPVDRALVAGELGVDAFRDRTIEMQEIDEEAVLVKNVRVVEEISLRKDVKDEERTFSDTVRITKVDIEDTRTVAGARTGLVGGANSLAHDMEVVGSDGQHVGIIDHVDGTVIKLKKLDSVSGGSHHLIPTEWVKTIDGKVTLKTAASDVMSRWTAT